jgi:soluble lytic murein transglycosylase-like protein
LKRPIIISSIAAIIVGGAAFAPAVATPVATAHVVAIKRTTEQSASRSYARTSVPTVDTEKQDQVRIRRYAVIAADKARADHVAAVEHAREVAIANAQALANQRAAEVRAANARAQALVQQQQAQPVQTPAPPKAVSNNYTPSGIAACIAHFESGGNAKAYNPSGASGLYQFMDGTWAGYGGYAHASDAPASVQTEKFYQVWAGGAGAGNWVTAPMCGY